MTPAETSATPETQATPLLSRMANFIDRRPNLVLPVWIATYLAVLWRAAHRPLWFDELLTYYVSTAPTAATFLHTRLLDQNPPLHYLFVRASIALFGDSPFAVRLPSLLGFLVAGLIVYALVSRRLGGALGLASLGILWSSWLTRYAVEARPYGLLLALFTIAAQCWWNAARASRWTLWHAGLAAATGAMFLTHPFSPICAAAMGAGELVRTIAARRLDKKVWAALLAPLAILPLYLPLIKDAGTILSPPAFAATLLTIPKLYLTILAPLLPSIGAIVLLWMASHGRGRRVLWAEVARPHEIAFAIAAFLAPVVMVCYSNWSGAPFWHRYAIGSILGATLMLTAVLAFAAKRNPNPAVAAAMLILILFCVTRAGTGTLLELYENTSTAYRALRPELPFVTASGLTFLEMDRREAPAFIGRLYYLTDKESAHQHHTTFFEGMPILKQWFPVRANVEPYRDFTSRNRQFLVLATKGFPEDWLLPKLAEDGAEIRLLRTENTGYRDHELYEVTLRP